MYAQQYAVYRTDANNEFGGREFVGYAGWHTNSEDALAEAIRRNDAGDYTPNTEARKQWGFPPVDYTPAPNNVLTVSVA